jgi:hypothetical protein
MKSAAILRSSGVVAVGFLLIFHIGILCFAIPSLGLKGAVDFRHLYTAGYMVRTGHANELHDYEADRKFQEQIVGPSEKGNHYNHLAYESLFFVPFSLLTYRTAYLIFFALNIALLGISYWLMRPYLRIVDRASGFLACAPFIAFLPVISALVHGQVSIILLVLFVTAMISYDRGNEMTAGALVGMTLFKFQFGIPFSLLFLIWRRYRFVAGFAISGFAVLALSLMLVGFSGFSDYVHALASTTSVAGMQRFIIPPERMPNIRGLIYTVGIGRLSETAMLVATAICSAAILVWAGKRKPAFSLAMTVAFLVSYHGLIPDATLLAIPLSLVLGCGLNGSMRKPAMCLLLVAIIVAAPTFLNLYGTRFYLMTIPILIFFGLTSFPPDGRWQTAPAQNRNFCPAVDDTRQL